MFAVASAGGTTGRVVVTVTGSDDAAVIGGATTGSVTEDDSNAATVSGTLVMSDSDTQLTVEQRRFTAQERIEIEWRYGAFTLETDGSWSYTLDDADPDTDALGAGETDTDVFTAASAGGTVGQVVITVRGSYDATVIGGATTGAVTEDATETVASGTLAVSDPDAGQDNFTAQTETRGRYGTFTLNSDGT